MTGRTFALLLAGALSAAFLLSLTLVAGFALVYAVTEGGGGGAGVYTAILAGCLLVWALAVLLWRRRARGGGGPARH